uniref:Granzyme K n=1 Tax=Latimeria chalumnae TaxID=7897 RepID=H2ZYH5_LATCH
MRNRIVIDNLAHVAFGGFLRSKDISVEIVGGKEVKPHSKPFMVSIQANNRHVCGGVLIKEKFVLTAAHCWGSLQDKQVNVVLGAHSLSKKEKSKQVFSVIKHIEHPTFKTQPQLNDIMVLQLNQKAKTNKYVAVKKLPRTNADVKPGTKCTVLGWGVTEDNSTKPSDTLREVTVAVIDRRVCNSPEYYNRNPVVTKHMLCAGDKNGGKDACDGDSGGPLICKGTFNGIVSGGQGCGIPNKPGIYTRLDDKYIPWIKNIIKSKA